MDEMKKRKAAKTLEKFHNLELSLGKNTECPTAKEPIQYMDIDIEQTLNSEIEQSISN
jgi:hypothetical protein